MARIPTIVRNREPVPGPTPRINSAAFAAPGRALASIGNALTAAGNRALAMEDRRTKFAAEAAFAKFDLDHFRDLNNRTNGTSDGANIANDFAGNFDKDAQGFLSDLPGKLQPEFTARMARLRTRHFKNAARRELGARSQFQLNTLTNNTIAFAGRLNDESEQLDLFKESIGAQIDATDLSLAEKFGAKQKAHAVLETQHALNRIKRGDTSVLRDLQRAPEPLGLDGVGRVLSLDGLKNVKGISLKRANRSNMAAVMKTAEQNGFDPVLAAAIGHFESNGTFSTKVGNSRSSALGIFQFLKSNRKEFGFGATAEEQAAAFVLKNNTEVASVEQRLGRPLVPWERYLVHFQGPGGAAALLRADQSKSVSSVVGSKVVAANPFMKGQTVGQFLGRVKGEIEVRMTAFGGAVSSTTEAAEEIITEEPPVDPLSDEAFAAEAKRRASPPAPYNSLSFAQRSKLLAQAGRAFEVQEDEAETKEEDELKKVQEAVSRDGLQLFREGKLTTDWVDAHAEELSIEDVRRFSSLARKPGTDSDNLSLYADLRRKAAKGVDVFEEAKRALSEGEISLRSFDRIMATLERTQRRNEAFSAFKKVDETPAATDDEDAKAEAEDENEIQDSIEGADRDPDKPLLDDEARAISEKKRAEILERRLRELPMPMDTEERPQSMADVKALVEQLRGAFKDGLIRTDELREQANILGEYQRLLRKR